MRKILVLLLLFVFALGCGSKANQAVTGKKSKGELVGIKGKKYYPEKPFGMVLVPGGAYIMGKSDDDLQVIRIYYTFHSSRGVCPNWLRIILTTTEVF